MRYFIFFVLFFLQSNLYSQNLGLLEYQSDAEPGYTLFSPFLSTNTYLIDNCGRKVHEWQNGQKPAASVVLLENGNLLRTSSAGPASNPVFAFGGGGEKIQEVDWDGVVQWEFILSDSLNRMHHDFVKLPNGNILTLVWELKTKEDAISAGRDTTLIVDDVLWGEVVIEVDMNGDIIWEWHMWDHLVQSFDDAQSNYGVIEDHAELLDINVTGGPTIDGGKNWLHINSLDFNPMMDQIVINSFFLSEFFVIDHSTTTDEAKGHTGGNSTKGGDILYRYGNPQNYKHGLSVDRTIYGAHNVHWVPNGMKDEGKIMFFNNGNGRPGGNSSSIDIIAPPIDDYSTGQYIYDEGVAFGPDNIDWSYSSEPKEDFYSHFLSGAQRLSNGNTLICEGAYGRLFEVDDENNIVWEYKNPVTGSGILEQGDTIPVTGSGIQSNVIFRTTRYSLDFEGFENVELTPGDPIELEFTQPYDCEIISSLTDVTHVNFEFYPNPAQGEIFITSDVLENTELQIFDLTGRKRFSTFISPGDVQVDLKTLSAGLYLIKVGNSSISKFVLN